MKFTDPISTVTLAGIASGKLISLLTGSIFALVLLPLNENYTVAVAVGLVFWYMTLGAVVALASGIERYPWMNISLPWWLRGLMLGAWMNFMVAVLASTIAPDLSVVVEISSGALVTPNWLVVDGMIAGFIAAGMVERVDRRIREIDSLQDPN